LRTVRILFVIFLALLIPIRGAVAGAMLCPAGGAPAAASSHMQHPAAHDGAMALHHDDSAHHDHAHHDQAQQSPPHTSHNTGCNLCTAFCSMTPMPSAAPTIEPSTLSATLSFPSLQAPAPSFQSGGPDRPPRSR
jgi:hypothetical protein